MEIVLAYGWERDMIQLVTEYTNGILEQGNDVVQCLNSQHLEDELKDMNLKYALPFGRMYLALVDGKAVGCAALTKNDEAYCEIKRLYLKPEYRGMGISKALVEIIIKDANKLIVNPNNLDVKLNYNTPVYAHYDRHKYFETIRNPNTHLDEQIEIHKCVLHIDTFISETNFNNVVYSVMSGSNILITQNTNDDNNTFILQEDSNVRLNVEENNYKINATYTSENYTKNTSLENINKTIVCSKKLKVHRDLYPFNYEYIFGQEVNDNE